MQTPDIDIAISEGHGHPAEHCVGPDASGQCPRVAAGEPVACAGRKVTSLHGLPLDGWRMAVRDDASICPYAWLTTRLGEF